MSNPTELVRTVFCQAKSGNYIAHQSHVTCEVCAKPEGEAPQADVETLLYDHQRAVEGVFEHGETGGFYDDLEASRKAIRDALAKSAATLSPLCGAQHAESADDALDRELDGYAALTERQLAKLDEVNGQHAESGKEVGPMPTSSLEDCPEDEQEWAKVDPAVAFHLIERHAEDWADAGRLMLQWHNAMSRAAQLDGSQEGSESNG